MFARSLPCALAEMAGLSLVCVVAAGCRPILGIESTEIDPAACALVTQRVFFVDGVVSDKIVEIGVVSRARWHELAGALGATLDPTRGHGVAEVIDCDEKAAAYAAADFEPSGVGITSFAVSGDGLVLGTDTGVEGVLGVLNLDTPAELEVTAYPDELEVESSAGFVDTRAGEITRIVLAPNSAVMVTPPTVSPWSCVGTIAAPVVSDATITLTIDIQDSSAFVPNGTPLAGVRVAVCLDDSAGCEAGASTPAGESTITDAAGRAQLVVSTGSAGFDGHLVISGSKPGCAD
jgi:hypothetical protein